MRHREGRPSGAFRTHGAAACCIFGVAASCVSFAAAQQITPEMMLEVRRSLPAVDAELEAEGLSDVVTIERDALGVVTIRAHDPFDAVFAHGFVHGQDRYFQMDLARRDAAGELSALVGPTTLGRDRANRHHQFRMHAERLVQDATPDQRRLLERYAQGVNAGLASLAAAPPEYVLLQVEPEPWRPADSALLVFTFARQLQFSGSFERAWGQLSDSLPPEVMAFLDDPCDRYAAPIAGHDTGTGPQPIPGPDHLNLRTPRIRQQAPIEANDTSVNTKSSAVPGGTRSPEHIEFAAEQLAGLEYPAAIGSNSWVVAGSRTEDGRAILAYDPHLMIALPGVWHRISMHVGDIHAHGVAAAGLPGVLLGVINGYAFGTTTPYVDLQDNIIIETLPDDPQRYRVPEGDEAFGEIVETIHVRGGDPEELRLRTTRWGVVAHTDHRGRPLVLKWTATEPRMIDLAMFDAFLDPDGPQSLDEMIDHIRRTKGLSQNWLIAAPDGRIAFVLSGALPRRIGFDGRTPVSWADGSRRWDGELDESLRPVTIDPPTGVLWTANNRTMTAALSRTLGYWPFWSDHRAYRIAELLASRGMWDEESLAQIQLDTHSHLTAAYRDHALSALRHLDEHSADTAEEPGASGADDAMKNRLQRIRTLVGEWKGTAEADETAYALLRDFRYRLRNTMTDSIRQAIGAEEFAGSFRIRDETMLRLLDARPDHWLPPSASSWEEFIRSTLLASATEIESQSGDLATPWGAQNTLDVGHVLADEGPAMLRQALRLPEHAQSGDSEVIRVARPDFGASMRMVVAPTKLDQALFSMPAGQSGHPLSPHFRDHHAVWAEGEYLPLLPGETVSTIRIMPATSAPSGDDE